MEEESSSFHLEPEETLRANLIGSVDTGTTPQFESSKFPSQSLLSSVGHDQIEKTGEVDVKNLPLPTLSSVEKEEEMRRYKSPPKPKAKIMSPSHPSSPTRSKPTLSSHLGPDAPSFVKRLYQYRDNVNDKVKANQALLRQRKFADCTFEPQLTAKQLTAPRRHPEELYYAAVERAKEIETMKEVSKERKSTDPNEFHPRICRKTKEMLGNRNPALVYSTLYTTTSDASKTLKTWEKLSFTPSINKRSEGLTRPKDIGKVLYEDAQRRNEDAIRPKTVEKPGKQVNKRSAQLVEHRFRSDFDQAVQSQGAAVMTQPQLSAVLHTLHFLRDNSNEEKLLVNRVWEHLKGKNGVVKDYLYAFLTAVMNLSPEGEEGLLSSKTIKDIHTVFHGLYVTRLQQKQASKAQNSPEYYLLSQTERPTVTSTQRIEDYLLSQRLKTERIQASKRLSMKRQVLADLQFRLTPPELEENLPVLKSYDGSWSAKSRELSGKDTFSQRTSSFGEKSGSRINEIKAKGPDVAELEFRDAGLSLPSG